MDPMTLAALMAAGGIAKSKFIDEPAQQRQALYQAQKTLYSPWTRLGPGEAVPAESPLSSGLNFGVQGLSLGMNLEEAQARNKMLKALSGGGEAPGPQGAPETITTPGAAPTFNPRPLEEPALLKNPPVYNRGPGPKKTKTAQRAPASFSIWV